MEPFTVLVRDGSHSSREKNSSRIAGNGVSMTCYTIRHGKGKVAPPRFARSFLIFFFYFSESCRIRFQSRPRLFSQQYSVYLWSGNHNKSCWGPTKMPYFIWCDFDPASSLICGNKMPTRCNRGFYCRSYCLLNMFRAPLCPSSGAQEYYTVVAACCISCCGFQVAGLSGLQASCKPDT